MPSLHVKKGDTVLVLSGRSRDKRGIVLSVLPKRGKVVVEGVNVVKRHSKPRPPKDPQGGIVEKPLPIDASNVKLVCPSCGKPTSGRRRLLEDGRPVRFCKLCDEQI